jgi:transposase
MERKVKYDYAFKLECVKLVLESVILATMYLLKNREIKPSKWIGFYKYYGAIGLLPRKNQSYSVAFKLNIVKSNCQRFIVFEIQA